MLIRTWPVTTQPEDEQATYEHQALVAHLPPDHAQTVKQSVVHQRLILNTVWETTRLPSEWDGHLAADAIVVPTHWNAGILLEAGAQNVHVIPHTLESGVPHVHTYDLRADSHQNDLPIAVQPETLVFYLISSWVERKSIELAVEAYLRSFRADEDVVLIIKTEPMTFDYSSTVPKPTATWELLARVIRSFNRPAPVVLATEHWTDAQVRALHKRGDCYLALPHAEGWGLGIFDAVLSGNAVVTTGWGGPAEYLANYPGLVPVTQVSARMFGKVYGEWAEPNLDDAIDRIREVRVDRGAALAEASRNLAPSLRSYCAPERVGRLLSDVCLEP